MDNKPMSLNQSEIKEIADIEVVRQMWGAENVSDMQRMLNEEIYAVKFRYRSGSPGYVGDYFILLGDAIGEALELIRDTGGAIVIIDDSRL
jgi:hypothetical protein